MLIALTDRATELFPRRLAFEAGRMLARVIYNRWKERTLMKSMKEVLGHRGLMLVCFSMTGLSGLGGILAMIASPDWATATTVSGITGFWFALGLFFEAEQSRERVDARVECRLNQILDEVKKGDCACRPDDVKDQSM